jgi:protein phosphatase
LASKLAVDQILHTYHKHAPEGPVAALYKAFQEANDAIYDRGRQNPEFAGMGTTGTALVLRPEGAWVGHVGDSRVYRVRGGQTEQLTFDHSRVWELARLQNVPPEQVQGVPANVIVRSLGPEPLVNVDVEGPHPVRAGDVFVVCSDGLSGQVSDREIGFAAEALPPAEACRFLVDLSNLRGGPDNITVIIVRVQGTSPEAKRARKARRKARPPWSAWELAVLAVGVAFSLDALVLVSLRYRTLGVISFFIAAVALLVGVALLGVRYVRERRGKQAAEPPRTVRVYRQTACPIDAPLLAQLTEMHGRLQQQVREKNWEVDWDAVERHLREAQTAAAAGDLHAAFRETCRATRFLTDAVQRYRNKEEVFLPMWDIPGGGPLRNGPPAQAQ